MGYTPQALETAKHVLGQCAAFGEGIPVSYAQAFIEIAAEPGLSLTTLSDRLNMPLSTVSRIVAALADKKYNLIEVSFAPDEKRRKVIILSDKGQEALAKF